MNWKYTEGAFARHDMLGRRIENAGDTHWYSPNCGELFVIYESYDFKYNITSLSDEIIAGPFDSIEPALVWLKLKGVPG